MQSKRKTGKRRDRREVEGKREVSKSSVSWKEPRRGRRGGEEEEKSRYTSDYTP